MLGALVRFPGGGGPGFGPRFGGPGYGYDGFGHPPVFPLFGLFMAAVWAAVLVVLVIAVWRILERSGHPGALGLLMVVPLVNVGLLAYLAFAPWPALDKAAEHGPADRESADRDAAASTQPLDATGGDDHTS